jgi:tetratricopeptide (TPR) repeat protein
VAILDWDWAAAEKLFRRALHAQPASDLSKHLFVMYFLLPMARLEEALAILDEARRIDPLSLFILASRTAVLLVARRTVEAESECRRALELDPDFWRAIVAMGRCYETQGQYENAIACYERAKVVSDRVPTVIGALGRAYALAGRHEEAYRVLEELDELARHRYVSPYGKVLVFLGLGDERVFDWLERSYEGRAGWLMYLAADPRFDSLRNNRRFRSFLEKLHLPIITYLEAGVATRA